MSTTTDRQLFVAGRTLMALMFLVSGLAKLASTHVVTAGYVGSDGGTLSTEVALALGLFETSTALLLVIGYRVKAMALMLAVFVMLSNAVFHRFWAFDPEFQFAQQVLFMKNLALIGGLIVLASSAHTHTEKKSHQEN